MNDPAVPVGDCQIKIVDDGTCVKVFLDRVGVWEYHTWRPWPWPWCSLDRCTGRALARADKETQKHRIRQRQVERQLTRAITYDREHYGRRTGP